MKICGVLTLSTLYQMNVGDLVSMHAANDETWYGEVVGVQGDNIDVYYIERGEDNVWSYSDSVYEVHKGCVDKHIVTSSCQNIVAALRELGFRPLSDCTFARIDEQGTVPLGDPAFDVDDDDCIGIHPEMVGFIVPDEEGEKFTFAEADNDFVRETHRAVRDFNRWQPTGEAVRVKNFIEYQESKACEQENARTRLGEAISYRNPPLR